MEKNQTKYQISELMGRIKTEPAKYLFEKYLRKNKLNSRLRRDISDLFFDAVRFYGIANKVLDPDFNSIRKEIASKDLSFDDLTDIFGIDPDIAKKVSESLEDLNEYKYFIERAPLTVRVNSHKVTRDMVISKLYGKYYMEKTEISPYGIILDGHENVRQIEEFKKGMFEIQDEASQLITFLVAPKPKEKILDLCAGTGGKSIAIQSSSFNSVDLDAYDISQQRLDILRKRSKLLGLNVNFPRNLTGKLYDKVLIDAPCSGSGTIRRDVDNLLMLNTKKLDDLLNTQRYLLEYALPLVKKGGIIIYVTCSFLRDENEIQIEKFLDSYHGKVELIPVSNILDSYILKKIKLEIFFKTSPRYCRMDAFFGAVIRVKN